MLNLCLSGVLIKTIVYSLVLLITNLLMHTYVLPIFGCFYALLALVTLCSYNLLIFFVRFANDSEECTLLQIIFLNP